MKTKAYRLKSLAIKECVKATPFYQQQHSNHVQLIGLPPKVFVTRQVFEDMYHIVDLSPKEVGWLGSVERLPSGDFLIKEVLLFRQEVTDWETKITTQGLSEVAQEVLLTRPNDGVEYLNSLRFWGHSHVFMDARPSPDDDTQMDVFGASGHPWFIRGILNKRGAMTFTVYLFESGVKILDVEWAIWEKVDDTRRDHILKQLNAKVTEKKQEPIVSPFGQNGQHFEVSDDVALDTSMSAHAPLSMVRDGGFYVEG